MQHYPFQESIVNYQFSIITALAEPERCWNLSLPPGPLAVEVRILTLSLRILLHWQVWHVLRSAALAEIRICDRHRPSVSEMHPGPIELRLVHPSPQDHISAIPKWGNKLSFTHGFMVLFGLLQHPVHSTPPVTLLPLPQCWPAIPLFKISSSMRAWLRFSSRRSSPEKPLGHKKAASACGVLTCRRAFHASWSRTRLSKGREGK